MSGIDPHHPHHYEDVDMADSDDDDLDDEEDEEDDDEDIIDDEDDGAVGTAMEGAQDAGATEEDSAIARRRAIQAIMRDQTISADERRMRIQNLMSGGRTEVAQPPAPEFPEQDTTSCVHYERNCNIIAPCCNRMFGCRVCHDDLSPHDHPPINRFAIREVVCRKCNTRQPAS